MKEPHLFEEHEVLALAHEAYERGTCDFPVCAERSALLVIDMQEEFVKPGWTPLWVPEATRIVPAVAGLVASCRELGIPVIFTAFARTHHFLDRPRSGPLMPNRYRHLGTDPEWFREARMVKELEPLPEDVLIQKPSYGAFYDTPLETILKNMGRDTILISGTMTNFCCGMTARQGYERGFHVVFGSDVTATDDDAMHENELKVLRKGFARVMTAAQITAELRGSVPASHAATL